MLILFSLSEAYGSPAPPDDASSHHLWQYGLFAAGGLVPYYSIHMPSLLYASPSEPPVVTPAYHFRARLEFANLGFEGGKILTSQTGRGPFEGRGELAFEVMPFWLAHYPAQTLHVDFSIPGNPVESSPLRSSNVFGTSITPVLLRWNFEGEMPHRTLPWVQLGAGVLWTDHKFPVAILSPFRTCVLNVTPQVGAGTSIGLSGQRTLDFALKAVHISNASLGDSNPGLNVTLQLSAGISWWR